MPTFNFQTAIARRLRLPILAPNHHFPGCSSILDTFGDHVVAISPCGARYGVVSRHDRHKDVIHALEEDAIKPAQLPTSTETPGFLPDIFGRPNIDRPAYIPINTPPRAAAPVQKKLHSPSTLPLSGRTPQHRAHDALSMPQHALGRKIKDIFVSELQTSTPPYPAKGKVNGCLPSNSEVSASVRMAL